MLPKAIYIAKAISIKIPTALKTKQNNDLKIYVESKKIPKNQSNSEKEQLGGIIFPDFKLCIYYTHTYTYS